MAWRDDDAIKPKSLNLSEDVISVRIGLMDKLHQPVPICKLPHQLGDRLRFVAIVLMGRTSPALRQRPRK